MCFDYIEKPLASRQTAGPARLWALDKPNSKQETRKSAEHRDNDTEIRDRLTPTAG